MSQPNHKNKRLEALFSQPSVQPDPAQPQIPQEVDALKEQVAELEARLAEQQSQGNTTVRASAYMQPLASRQEAKKETEQNRKQIALWIAKIFIAISVTFSGFSIFATLVWQAGKADLNDQVLMPTVLLMAIANLVAHRLIQRGQVDLGIWTMYLVDTIPLPILAVLTTQNIYVLSGGFLVIFTLMFMGLVLPKGSLWKAIVTAAGGLIVVSLVELWNPAFRVGGHHLNTFTPVIIALALLAAFAFIVRQAASGNIRTKLITSFVVMATLSMGIVALLLQRSLSTSLTENIGNNLSELASAKAIEIGQAVDRESDLLKTLALNSHIRAAAASANLTNLLSQEEIARRDAQWAAAISANNDADPIVAKVLYNSTSVELRDFQDEFPQHAELFLTNQAGINIASTNFTSDYYQADEEWWQIVYQEGLYIGQPAYDESTQRIAIPMAAAILDEETGKVLGILRATVDFEALSESLVAGRFGQTGHTDIYLPTGQELTLDELQDGSFELVLKDAELDTDTLFAATTPYIEIEHEGILSLASQAKMGVAGDTDQDTQVINDLNWRVVSIQEQSEALQPVRTQTRNLIVLLLVINIAVILAAIFLARVITQPIIHLKTSAEKVALGDLTVQANVETQDEIGTLASAFNEMTSQLQGLFSSLEQRVQDRTHDLELASEVGRTITEKVAHLDDLLTTAAEMIRSRFHLYYTQVYLMDPSRRRLVLRAGTGEVGEQLLKRNHYLLVDANSLNGRTVLDQKPVIVADTEQSPSFRPNPLLPNTRSEMTVPLIAGDQVIGVLDMQSDQPGALNETNLPAFEALAGQLAVALQNASLFARAEEAHAEVQSQMRQMTERGWQDFMNAIERGRRLGYAFDQSQVLPLQGESLEVAPIDTTLSVPLQSSGTDLGIIQLTNEPDHTWESKDVEVTHMVAARLSQHIDNLRLLAQAEHYRAEAEQAVRRLTRDGWESYLQSELISGSGFEYDLEQVHPLNGSGNEHQASEVVEPLTVRNERIGELSVQTAEEEDKEIVSSIAAQLSDHIENLRLFEQTQSALSVTRQSEAKLSEALNIARLANWEYDFENDRFIFNDQFYTIFHTTAEKVGGYKLSSAQYAELFVHPEDGALVGQEIGKVFASTERYFSANLEHRTVYADGGIGYMTVEVHVVRDENGKIIRWYGANQDITERKLAELAVQESEAKLSEALHIAKLANWEYDVEKDLFSFNDNFYSIFHTTAKEVGGYKLSSMEYAQRFVHPEDMPIVGGEIEKALSSTDRHYSTRLEHRVLFADGGMGYISVEIHIDRDENGKIIRYYGANQDITERKQAELVIQESEARLSEALQIAKLANWEYDFDNDQFIFNDYFYSIFHTTVEKVGGYKLSSAQYTQFFVHPDDAALVGKEIGKAIASTEKHFSTKLEHRVVYADGGVGYISVDVHVDRDDDGKIVRWYGANQDITERKLAEIAIQESEAKLSEALQIAKLANWEYDFDNDQFIFNDHFYSIFHTTVDKVGGYKLSSAQYAQFFVHPDDAALVGEEIGKAIASTEKHFSTKLEHRVIYADGGIGYISVDVHVDRDDDGKIVRWYGANQDITERKKAEEVVRMAQERAQVILETVTIPMVITRISDNVLTFINQPATEVAGVKYEEAINRPAPDFYYNPEERKKFITELRERGRVFDMVVQLKRNEEPFWALLSARIFSYQNEPSILTTFMDITDRVNAEEAVAQRAAELQTVAEVSTTTATTLEPDTLLQSVVDLTKERFDLYHAHIYLADDAWQTLLLAAGAGEVGKQMVADGWNISMDHESSIVAEAARSRRSVIANDVYRDQESGFLSNKLLPDTRSEMAVPMIVGDKVLGVFDVQSDVSGRFTQEDANIYTTLASQVGVALQNARLYVEQAATVAQLRELDRLKSAFLANMSHELRTPLNSILGFADVMLEELDGPLTEYMNNDLRLIQKNGQHLLHLINDVLDMAKIEAGRMNLNPEQFRVYEVLEDVTSITSSLASDKNLALHIDDASDQEVQIYADRTRLRQVMINLVNNSIKFTETGQVMVKVTPMDGARVLISVKDTGIGIPPDKLDAVFLEFTQVDTSTTRKVGGTGLGLPISRRLVEMHGGRLWAESTGVSGEGSTFFVELPLEARITEVIEKQAK